MIYKIFIMLFGIFIVIDGVYAIAKGRNIGSKDSKARAKYTEESYTRYMRIAGVLQIIMGLALLAFDVQNYFYAALFGGFDLLLVCGIIIGVCVVLVIVLYFVIPKKRNDGTEYVQSSKNEDNDEYIDED